MSFQVHISIIALFNRTWLLPCSAYHCDQSDSGVLRFNGDGWTTVRRRLYFLSVYQQPKRIGPILIRTGITLTHREHTNVYAYVLHTEEHLLIITSCKQSIRTQFENNITTFFHAGPNAVGAVVIVW